jgi:hypothetical protein
MKKMDIHRKKIHNKKMVDAADCKCGLRGSDVKGDHDVDVKKRAEQTYNKEQKIGLGPAATQNRQNGQPEKATQRQ